MRIDKYDPKSGGFRAALHEDTDATPGGLGDADNGIGVALTSAGKVVHCGHASDATGLVGILTLTRDMKAGEIVDVMTDGEMVEFDGAAGARYAVTVSTGVIVAETVPLVTTQVRIGHTVEADRLVVRIARAAKSVVDTDT